MITWTAFRYALPSPDDCNACGCVAALQTDGRMRAVRANWVSTADLWQVNGFHSWAPLPKSDETEPATMMEKLP